MQAYLDATTAEHARSWLSAAPHALEESTRKGYAAALRKLRGRSRQYHAANPREALELEITEMVARENALKKLLSGCRQLDKLRLHPTFVEPGDC